MATRKPGSAALHPDDRERIRATVGKQEHGDDGYDTLEYRERHKDGHYIWILSRGRPVEWDKDGNVVRTIGTDTDITRLKEVEQALAEEKERLRVTLESIGDGVISTDAERRISFMNPIAEEMTGWSSEEAVGKQPRRRLPHGRSRDRPRHRSIPVAESLNSGRLYYLDEEVVLVGRRGERRDIRSSAAPVRTPEGKTMGAVLVFQDITQSRALQKQLAHSASHDALTGPSQPRRLRPRARRRRGECPRRGPDARALLHRSRPLQAGQRQRRSRRGRCAPAAGLGHHPALLPRPRFRRAARRRRVRDPLDGL